MTDLEKDRIPEDLLTLLFGNVLQGGITEVPWEDVPKLTAKLEQAGFTVRGEFLSDKFGEKKPVISVELKIKVKGIR